MYSDIKGSVQQTLNPSASTIFHILSMFIAFCNYIQYNKKTCMSKHTKMPKRLWIFLESSISFPPYFIYKLIKLP